VTIHSLLLESLTAKVLVAIKLAAAKDLVGVTDSLCFSWKAKYVICTLQSTL